MIYRFLGCSKKNQTQESNQAGVRKNLLNKQKGNKNLINTSFKHKKNIEHAINKTYIFNKPHIDSERKKLIQHKKTTKHTKNHHPTSPFTPWSASGISDATAATCSGDRGWGGRTSGSSSRSGWGVQRVWWFSYFLSG